MRTIFGRDDKLFSLTNITTLSQEENRLTWIVGNAGVGKTTLLQQLPFRFNPDPLMIVGDKIIDFDDFRFRLTDGLLVEVARQLGSDNFFTFLNIVRSRRQVEKRGASPEKISRLSLNAINVFADNLRRITEQKKVVLFFDTIEKTVQHGIRRNNNILPVEVGNSLMQFLEIVSNIPNIYLFMAGRYVDILENAFRSRINSIEIVNLEPLDQYASLQILAEGQKHRGLILQQDWSMKVYHLSGGMPIFLDMAVEWLERDSTTFMKWLSDDFILQRLNRIRQAKHLKDLVLGIDVLEWLTINKEQGLVEFQDEFKKELVSYIAKLKSTEDLLILTLAKINPLDVEGIAEVLDISIDEAIVLYDQAKQKVHMKVLPDGRIKLADAVEELVNEYVWEQIDSEGVRERYNNLRAINYLTNKTNKQLEDIKELRDKEFVAESQDNPIKINDLYGQRLGIEHEFWVLRSERLERQMSLDVGQAFQDFIHDFQLADQFGYIVARESLFNAIPDPSPLSPENHRKYEKLLAQHFIDTGKYEKAERIYNELVRDGNKDSIDKIEALTGQGACLMRIETSPGSEPSITRAVSKYRSAYNLASRIAKQPEQKEYISLKAQTLLSIGWAYRTYGLLKKSQDYYNKCFQLAVLEKLDAIQALSLNGLAYVYSLQKGYEKAADYSQGAIDIWQGLIAREPDRAEYYRNRLTQAYNTAGEIWIQLDQPERAIRFFEISVHSFRELAIEEWLSRALSGRGWAKWMIGKENVALGELRDNSLPIWESALEDLLEAYEVATYLDVPLVMYRLAYVHLELRQPERTVALWLESNKIARQIGDRLIEYGTLVGLAGVAIEFPVTGYQTLDDFQEARNDFFARNPDVNYPEYDGLFYIYLGNMAMVKSDLISSADNYRKGFSSLSRGGLYSDFTLKGQIKNIEKTILPRCKNKDIQEVGKMILDSFSKSNLGPDVISHFTEWSRWKYSGRLLSQ